MNFAELYSTGKYVVELDWDAVEPIGQLSPRRKTHLKTGPVMAINTSIYLSADIVDHLT